MIPSSTAAGPGRQARWVTHMEGSSPGEQQRAAAGGTRRVDRPGGVGRSTGPPAPRPLRRPPRPAPAPAVGAHVVLVVGPRDAAVEDVVKDLLGAVGVEGRRARHKLVQDRAQGPPAPASKQAASGAGARQAHRCILIELCVAGGLAPRDCLPAAAADAACGRHAKPRWCLWNCRRRCSQRPARPACCASTPLATPRVAPHSRRTPAGPRPAPTPPLQHAPLPSCALPAAVHPPR